MFKKLPLFILALAGLAGAACSTLTIPTDYLTVDAFRRANQAANWTATAAAHNNCKDSLNNGPLTRIVNWTTNLTMKSLQDLALKIDDDNNGTHKLAILNGSADTLAKFTEDTTARFYRHVAVDSNVTIGKNLTVTGTTTHTGASAFGSGTYSGTLGVTGLTTAGGGLAVTGGSASGVATTGDIVSNGTNGLVLVGRSGASNDILLANHSGQTVFNNPAGGVTGVFPGAITMSSTLGVAGLLTATAGVSVPDLTGLYSTITFPRSMVTRSGTNLYVGDADGWTSQTSRITSGSFGWTIGTSPTTYLTLSSSALTVVPAATMAGITSSGDIAVSKSTASTAAIISAVQTDNTSGTSNARLQATTDPLGGDPFTRYTTTGVTNWSTGLDNSDGDAYVITPATTPGGATNGLKITTAGAVTVPGTLDVTGKITGSDTVVALLGFRAGNTGASNTILYRSGADMWFTPDSLTAAGKIVSGKEVIGTQASYDTTSALTVNAAMKGPGQTGIYVNGTASAAASTDFEGIWVAHSTANSSAITDVRGLYINTPTIGSGASITNNYGIQVTNITGGTNNWALRTGQGKVQLGDSLKISRSLTFTNAATPPSPDVSESVRMYQKGSMIIFQYNDAGTVRYKYLDMAGTGVTWVHTTSAP